MPRDAARRDATRSKRAEKENDQLTDSSGKDPGKTEKEKLDQPAASAAPCDVIVLSEVQSSRAERRVVLAPRPNYSLSQHLALAHKKNKRPRQ